MWISAGFFPLQTNISPCQSALLSRWFSFSPFRGIRVLVPCSVGCRIIPGLGYVVNNHGDPKSPKDQVVGPLLNSFEHGTWFLTSYQEEAHPRGKYRIHPEILRIANFLFFYAGILHDVAFIRTAVSRWGGVVSSLYWKGWLCFALNTLKSVSIVSEASQVIRGSFNVTHSGGVSNLMLMYGNV